MAAIPKLSSVIIAEVAELRLVHKAPRSQADAKLELPVDYERVDFYEEARDIGKGPFGAHLSYLDAVQKFMFGG